MRSTIYGVQIAFRKFNAGAGITGGPWVGWANFPFPIILALALNYTGRLVLAHCATGRLCAVLHLDGSLGRHDPDALGPPLRPRQPTAGSTAASVASSIWRR
jgi:hypothetical protein